MDFVEVVTSRPLSDWSALITPLAIFLSVIGASIWFYCTIVSNRNIAKQRCTMDFIMDRSRDKNFTECFRQIRKLHGADDVDIRRFGKPSDQTEGKYEEEGEAIGYILNQYEYMAVGVDAGIYDESILKEATKTSTITVFKMVKPFIEEVREYAPSAYKKYEDLVNRWSET